MRRYSGQTVLPFPGLAQPWGVTVDAGGAVYVTDFERDPNAPPGLGVTLAAGVWRLAPGAAAQRLPIDGLASPHGVAVDGGGAVLVADNNFATPIRLPVGGGAPEVLPAVAKGAALVDVAVEPQGGLLVAYGPALFGGGRGGVVRLAERTRRFFKPANTTLPFDPRFPSGMAVDARGGVYVVDSGAVLHLPPGGSAPTTLPFTGLRNPTHVAVDARGDVYVTDAADGGRVIVLDAATNGLGVLPFVGLSQPRGVAVDAVGNVTVADYMNRRVIRLLAED